MKNVAVVIVALLCCSYVVFAQSDTATISGRVTDPSGAAISGAEVQVQNVLTGWQVSIATNSSGLYVAQALQPGTYRIIVNNPGFKQIVKPNVVLNVQDNTSLNFGMTIGSASETVTVEGGAPLINTSDGAVSTVVDHKFVENMPLNGRSFQTLITLAPGVVVTPTSYANQGQFSVNGQRQDANYFTVDGVSANIGIAGGEGLPQSAGGSLPGLAATGGTNSLVSVDAMQEFRIQTSTFAPEYGRAPGGQISIATRAGTNEFHGTAFDYFRNDVMDANNWFADHSHLPKPEERQNDFGGVFGGPLFKNHTFFFGSYEGLRLRQPLTAETLVPDENARAEAPAGVQPFLLAFPKPNGQDVGRGLAEFNSSYSNPLTLNAYSIRIDHMINATETIFGRYSYSPSSATQRESTALSSVQMSDTTNHTVTVGLTSLVTHRLTNDLRANYSNVRGVTSGMLENFGGASVPPPNDIFAPGYSSRNSHFTVLILGAGTGGSAFSALLDGTTARNEQRQINIVDNISLALGRHQLKFGTDYRWLSPLSNPPAYQASFAFLGVSGGPGFALSGTALQASIGANQSVALLSKNISFYGQDSWQVKPRLTITYGARWDIDPAPEGKNRESDPLTLVDVNDPSNFLLAPEGTPLFSTRYENIAPRIGAAYQLCVSPGWSTVLRGGFGTFYDFGTGNLGQLTFGFPFTADNIFRFVPLPLTSQQANPPTINKSLPAGDTVYVADRHLKTPRTYEWNVTMEQLLGPNQSLSIGYIGAAGRDLLRADSLFNPNPDFHSVSITRNTATSDYDALQVSFHRKLSSGFQALASYTFAHSIDVASNDGNVLTTPTSVANPIIDRGNSDFDVRHSLTAGLTFDIPHPKSLRAVEAFIRDWSMDGFVTARTASPVDLIASTSFVAGREFSVRPNVTPGVPFYLYGNDFAGSKALNPAAFSIPAAGQGDLGRNVLRAFGAWQADMTLRRQFRISERCSVQLRGEFFNILNHPNFGPPTNALSSALFGRSTQTLAASLGSGGSAGGFNPLYQIGGPRSIQVGLKLQF
jgi:carboxypeptidase family protein